MRLASLGAGILHLGNVTFSNVGDAQQGLTSPQSLNSCAKLLGVSPDSLLLKLTTLTRSVRGEEIVSPLQMNQATTNRDALAKHLYSRLFDWLMRKVNESMGGSSNSNSNKNKNKNENDPNETFIGVLDIFGFEIFETNRFEQLCINLANEKLQKVSERSERAL